MDLCVTCMGAYEKKSCTSCHRGLKIFGNIVMVKHKGWVIYVREPNSSTSPLLRIREKLTLQIIQLT